MNKEDEQQLLNEIKLSYEIHKKVYNADICFAIPKGKKCLAWFTYVKDKHVCILLDIGWGPDGVKIMHNKYVPTCFSSTLCSGTCLYGTQIIYDNTPFFAIEDILMYRGKNMNKTKTLDKWNILHNMMQKEIQQVAYNNSFLVFGFPVMDKKFMDLINRVQDIPYEVSHISYRFYNATSEQPTCIIPYFARNMSRDKQYHANTQNHTNTPRAVSQKRNDHTTRYQLQKENNTREKLFYVAADIQDDIYHLFYENGDYYDVACIPDYKTSVMMNKLFRHIKENANLDLLEESDDEDEFQNEKVDKFVDLKQRYAMICTFHAKSKKWMPTMNAFV